MTDQNNRSTLDDRGSRIWVRPERHYDDARARVKPSRRMALIFNLVLFAFLIIFSALVASEKTSRFRSIVNRANRDFPKQIHALTRHRDLSIVNGFIAPARHDDVIIGRMTLKSTSTRLSLTRVVEEGHLTVQFGPRIMDGRRAALWIPLAKHAFDSEIIGADAARTLTTSAPGARLRTVMPSFVGEFALRLTVLSLFAILLEVGAYLVVLSIALLSAFPNVRHEQRVIESLRARRCLQCKYVYGDIQSWRCPECGRDWSYERSRLSSPAPIDH
ncbi:MAG: hypothetical protein AAF432_15210 [Planctomycetota bacterium]